MCLTTDCPKAKRANKDIIVYKIFYSGIDRKTGKEVLSSPYFNAQYYKDKKYFKANFKITNHDTIWEYFRIKLRYSFKREGYKMKSKPLFLGCYYEIEDGFIHSCTTKDEAIERIGNGDLICELCEVYECVIPKNTFFYEGDNELNDIASRKLKVIKRVY